MASAPEPTTALLRRHLHVEAIQTVTPMKSTEPGRPRPIAAACPLGGATLRAGHLRVVLYYRRAREEDSGWAVAGWLKESLSAALSEHPILAGRLRRRDGDPEGLELRLNDAGARLVQARAEATMAELLAADDREALEAHLAYWVDVDPDNPQFSALLHVQVTSFQDGGYSIGISCSLLLADPLLISGFLQKWAHIHSEMQADHHFSQKPIFYLGNLRKAGGDTHLRSTPMDSLSGYTNRTVLFDCPVGIHDLRRVAAVCLDQATRMVGEKAEEVSEFLLIVTCNDRLEELKVNEHCMKEELSMSSGSFMGSPSVVDWDRLHGDELAFGEGNRPVRVSYHIVTGPEQAVVMVMSALEDGKPGLISVTLPRKVQ